MIQSAAIIYIPLAASQLLQTAAPYVNIIALHQLYMYSKYIIYYAIIKLTITKNLPSRVNLRLLIFFLILGLRWSIELFPQHRWWTFNDAAENLLLLGAALCLLIIHHKNTKLKIIRAHKWQFWTIWCYGINTPLLRNMDIIHISAAWQGLTNLLGAALLSLKPQTINLKKHHKHPQAQLTIRPTTMYLQGTILIAIILLLVSGLNVWQTTTCDIFMFLSILCTQHKIIPHTTPLIIALLIIKFFYNWLLIPLAIIVITKSQLIHQIHLIIYISYGLIFFSAITSNTIYYTTVTNSLIFIPIYYLLL